MYRKDVRRLAVLGNRAFTLLEVVIAMLLLGIALLALMALQIRSIQSNAFSNCLTVASCFARDQVETLRAATWDDIGDGTYSETVTDEDPDTRSARMVFTRQWVVQTDPTDDRMKNVSVTVSWSQDGRPHQMSVNTRIVKRE
jgi:type IV pilus modification protein PilV